MFKKAIALAAIFAAVAQASVEAGGHPGSKPEDHQQYHPEAHAKEAHAKAAGLDNHKHSPGHGPGTNSSYTMPSLSPHGTAPLSVSISASGFGAPTLGSGAPITTAPGNSGAPAQPSSGFPTYANSSNPSITLGPSVTTKIMTTTITSCPVIVTHGEGENASTETYYTTSTQTITSTITVCTECVEVPKTSSPAASPDNGSPGNGSPDNSSPGNGSPDNSSPGNGSPDNSSPGNGSPNNSSLGNGSPDNSSPQQSGSPEGSGENPPESVTLTYTIGSGQSTTVITTTIKKTHTTTNTHTVYATPSREAGSPENSSPQNSSPDNSSPENSSPENSSPQNSSPDNSSPDNSSPDNSSPDNSSPDNSSPANGEQCEGDHCITPTRLNYKVPNEHIAASPNTCPEQVTVTVPGPDVTVTVTAMEGPPSNVPGVPGQSQPHTMSSSAHYGNGTLPGTSASYPSTGFITMAHPAQSQSDIFPTASAHADS